MFLLWVLWVLPLGEKVPHIAFVCVWAKCVFWKVLCVPFVGSVGVALGREGPTHCLCVCLGQVRVFEGSVCSLCGFCGCCPWARRSHTWLLCVFGPSAWFRGFCVLFLWVVWVLSLGRVYFRWFLFGCLWLCACRCVCQLIDLVHKHDHFSP